MIRDYSNEFLRDMAKAIDDGLNKASLEGEQSASASMPGAGAQLIGRTSGGKKKYQPSSPGSPPGVREGGRGGLLSRMTNARLQTGVWAFGVQGGTKPFYARYLELGTSRMAARPFLRPVLVRDRIRLERAFTQAASRSLARSVTRGRA